MVAFVDIDRWKVEAFGVVGDYRPWFGWVDKRFYVKWYAFVLQWFNCFWVDNRCATIAEFDSLFVRENRYDLNVVVEFWVGIHHTRHVFPDGYSFGIKKISKDCSSIVGTFATESCSLVSSCASEEALSDCELFVEEGFAAEVETDFHIYVSVAVVGIGDDAFAYVNPFGREANVAEICGYDSS